MVNPNSGQAALPNSFALSVTAQPLGGTAGVVAFATSSPSAALIVSLYPAAATLPAQATLVLTDTHTGTVLLPGAWYNVPVTATTGLYTQVVNVGLLVGGSRVHLPLIRR